MSNFKVYVGNLGNNGSKSELERVFQYYGTLKNVWVARNPPGFAFVEFEDQRDAEDAVHDLDGRTICGVRARVEMSSGAGRGRGGDRRGGDRNGDRRYGRDRIFASLRNYVASLLNCCMISTCDIFNNRSMITNSFLLPSKTSSTLLRTLLLLHT